MPRDAAATRQRILEAAISEFASHGLSGARIDRIAEIAQANKRSIYVYFGSKENLFSATLNRVLHDVGQAVVISLDDFPDYAGRLFDHLQAHPEALRLGLWRRLERPTSGPDESAFYAEQVAILAGGDVAGGSAGLPAIDLIVLILGMAQSWLLSPDDLRAADGADPRSPERLAVHRAALVEAVRRVCSPWY
jgi:AcrR family transcriptional regulator